jgi:hypothetical protein
MNDSIELTLQSVHGIIWNPEKYGEDENIFSKIKACVSFSGSAPNMQVSSFTMCPKSGNLVVDSNVLELNEAEDLQTSTESKNITMCAKFDDPFEAKQAKRRLSSSNSASSATSGSSYRPHLQFGLPEDKHLEMKHADKYDCKGVDSQDEATSIYLHITLRADDPGASSICHEGVARLDVPAKFENLPTAFDLPIIQTSVLCSETTEEQSSMIHFSDSAYIRILLSSGPDRQERIANDPSISQSDLIFSENLDEIQLGGMVKLMHEKDEVEDARQRAGKLLINSRNNDYEKNHNNGEPKRRNWVFFCNGPNDFNHSFQTFFDLVRGCDGPKKVWTNTRCMDPDQDLFLSTTMASTIDTRDSLEI